jgi:hypothetical protein
MHQLVEENEFEQARALAVPGTSQYYETEILIALAQGEWARSWQLFEEWEQALPESSFRRDRLREFTRAMYLADTDIPVHEGMHPMLRALLEPEKIVATYRAEDPLQVVGESRHMYTVALSVLGRCEEILEFLQPYELAARDDYGLASDGHSVFALAELEAECQAVLGQGARASAMAARLLRIMDKQPLPDDDDFLEQSRALLYFLSGDASAAAELLEQQLQQGMLLWSFFRFSPAARLFEQDPALRGLKRDVQVKLNAERARLGWQPVEI